MIVLASIAAVGVFAVAQDPGNDSSVQGNAWSTGNNAASPFGEGEFCGRACQSPTPPSDFGLRQRVVRLIREDKCEAATALAVQSRDGRLIRRVVRDCPASGPSRPPTP